MNFRLMLDVHNFSELFLFIVINYRNRNFDLITSYAPSICMVNSRSVNFNFVYKLDGKWLADGGWWYNPFVERNLRKAFFLENFLFSRNFRPFDF